MFMWTSSSSGFDFLGDGHESFLNRLEFRPAQHADALQHRGMGQAALDVMPPQSPVERNGFGETGNILARTAGEAAAAGDRSRRLLAHKRVRHC
jgi:hypothetical protein